MTYRHLNTMRCHVALLLPLVFVTALVNATRGQPVETRLGGVIRGPTDSRRIALVFTGHEYAEGADSILAQLARHGGKASFFLTGDFLADSNLTGVAQRVLGEGHFLGPHSDKHLLYCSWEDPGKTLVTRGEFIEDLNRNLEKIRRLRANLPPSQPASGGIEYFLPAFEHYNQQIASWCREQGITLVNFTPGTRSNADYTGETDKNFVSSKTIFDSIVAKERQDPHGLNGFILLLHIGAGPKRGDKFHARFGDLLDYLAGKGYQFVRVDQLLAPGIFVRASQIGYRPKDVKNAIAFSKSPLPAEFIIRSADSGQTCFAGKSKPITGVAWGQFDQHAELDFSALQTPGRYVVCVGTAQSYPFVIGAEAYAALPDQLLEFMRQQRCGFNPWLDAACHQWDGRTAYGPSTNGTCLDARGGWHDAADLLKYLLTSGNATAQMLLAYELSLDARDQKPRARSPKAGAESGRAAPLAGLADRVDGLGKPAANGVPDLLDEARWGLDWMLKLHPAPDQLYHQVADDRDHAGRRLPQNENVDYGWGKGGARVVYFADGQPQGLRQYKSASTGVANLAGRYAAAMALAFEVWHADPRRRPFAEQCLRAAKEVYELGRAKEGVQQGNSYGAPYRYEETTWADDMEWGAAELYRATREPRYLEEAKRYARLAGSESWMGREQTAHYQYYPFMNAGHFRLYDLVDAAFKPVLAGYYREGIERCLDAGAKNPYRIGVPFIWCSDNLAVALATQCLFYERMTGDARYHEFAARQRDWLLGRNPWGYSMFTQVGSVYPKDPHLMTMQITKRPVRGGLVDGPVYERIFKSLKGVSITEPDPLAAFQGQAVYHDDVQDYSSNEPTMDGTASAILLWALCSRPQP